MNNINDIMNDNRSFPLHQKLIQRSFVKYAAIGGSLRVNLSGCFVSAPKYYEFLLTSASMQNSNGFHWF